VKANGISRDVIAELRRELDRHPVYRAVDSVAALRRFMEYHVYSVWDFMSLIKSVQAVVAPAASPWTPRGDAASRRFINELVLEEESDEGLPDAQGQRTFSSHFELYCAAMREIGADDRAALTFVERVQQQGLQHALQTDTLPAAAREFTRATFRFIDSGKPHVTAAALALGREHIIPDMFRALLDQMAVSREQAPTFYYYIERHIHLDEGAHAPMSLRLLDQLCGGDQQRIDEAVAAGREAVRARVVFWDAVLAVLSRKAA
jgi:hypothetical protein